ncbi:MAG: hypothetical protein C0622_08415 [Desulfuromonas sp.]|nr:MAG: hypothetical protein C0622_08415 [Desulfuromonas sp.]
MSTQNSDFNDLAQKKGLKAVKDNIKSVTDANKGRPFGHYIVKPDGVYQTITHKDDTTEEVYFCTRLEPEGIARTTDGGDYTLILNMTDMDGRQKPWLLSQEAIFRSGGEEARVEFVKRGGAFGPGTRERSGFSDLIKSFVRHPRHLPRITLTSSTGWIASAEHAAFVLPQDTIGTLSKEKVVLTNCGAGAPDYSSSGTLDDWQQNIGRLCVGNSRLAFACCLPLAAPLLFLRGLGGGGFNIVGPSSCGKTTALHVAASVSGPPSGQIKTCDATANSLESTAAQHSDSVLLLDELGQAHPEGVGQVIYKLAGGIGRGRADQYGNARERRQWRILFLINGETTAADMTHSAGRRSFTGQELRLADIEADTGSGHGLFDTIHGFDTAAALSDHLRAAAGQYHGSLLREYLTKLVADINNRDRNAACLRWIDEIQKQFNDRALPIGASGQVHRVAARFALVAAGGELGTYYSLTGWKAGEALSAAITCFNAWLARRGTAGQGEESQLLQQVSAFFERYGESRFQPWDSKSRGTPPPNRAGFRRSVPLGNGLDIDDTALEYYVLPSAYRDELCAGFETRWASKVLINKGLLIPGNDDKPQSTHRLPGMGPKKVYHFGAVYEKHPAENHVVNEMLESPF